MNKFELLYFISIISTPEALPQLYVVAKASDVSYQIAFLETLQSPAQSGIQ